MVGATLVTWYMPFEEVPVTFVYTFVVGDLIIKLYVLEFGLSAKTMVAPSNYGFVIGRNAVNPSSASWSWSDGVPGTINLGMSNPVGTNRYVLFA